MKCSDSVNIACLARKMGISLENSVHFNFKINRRNSERYKPSGAACGHRCWKTPRGLNWVNWEWLWSLALAWSEQKGVKVPQFVVVEVVKGSSGKEIGTFVIQDVLFPLGPHKLP